MEGKQMNFLITGITGFAGPHLANLLHRDGHKVFGLIRGTNGMETDICDIVPRYGVVRRGAGMESQIS